MNESDKRANSEITMLNKSQEELKSEIIMLKQTHKQSTNYLGELYRDVTKNARNLEELGHAILRINDVLKIE